MPTSIAGNDLAAPVTFAEVDLNKAQLYTIMVPFFKSIFRSWKAVETDAFLNTALVGCLQIYITLMELKLQYEQDDAWNEILCEAFDKYMYYVLGMDDYFSFRRFCHPYAREAYDYHTLVYINREFDNGLNFLNDSDALLYALDDHIRFQWERYRKLVIVEGMDKNNAINTLPAVAYLSITDDNGTIHLQRLVWKSCFSMNEK